MQQKNQLKIVGLDPSYRNWGVAICTLSSDLLLTVDKLHTIQTAGDASIAIKSADDINCANILYYELTELLQGADVIIAEIPTGSRTAAGMKGHGVCIGLLGYIQSHYRLVQVTPYDIKKLVGTSATKAQIIALMDAKHPDTFSKSKQGILLQKNEHEADALAAIYAATLNPAFKQLIQSLFR